MSDPPYYKACGRKHVVQYAMSFCVKSERVSGLLRVVFAAGPVDDHSAGILARIKRPIVDAFLLRPPATNRRK
jgi:hypothetical protein